MGRDDHRGQRWHVRHRRHQRAPLDDGASSGMSGTTARGYAMSAGLPIYRTIEASLSPQRQRDRRTPMTIFKKGRYWYIDYYVKGMRKRKKIGPSTQESKLP